MAPEDDKLKSLAEARFTDLTQAEIRLLRAVPNGEIAVCGPNGDDKDPANDPTGAGQWGPEREIRPDLIRWLCVDPQARELADPAGIRAFGAKISTVLDLSYVSVRSPLFLLNCRIADDFRLKASEISELNLRGSFVHSIFADSANIKGNVFLRDGFRAGREVRLLGVQIGGVLDCGNAEFRNPGRALSADGIRVGGNVHLDDGFRSQGEVRLLSAIIGGDLVCVGATFKGMANATGENLPAVLNADRISVGGSIFLTVGFLADGQIRLVGAQIGRNLDCSTAMIGNTQRDSLNGGTSLTVEGAFVGGNVFFRDGFRANGEVRLVNAQIKGNLECDGGTFMNSGSPGNARDYPALTADGVHVDGAVFLRNGFRADGDVRLFGAQIGGYLDCWGGSFDGALVVQAAVIKGPLIWIGIRAQEEMALDLRNTTVNSLSDDEASWPRPTRLVLDGFIYDRISRGPTDVKRRLKWLALQSEFALQPYRQLAKVLREQGRSSGAQRVLFEMEGLRRKEEDRGWIDRAWSSIFRNTFGYGYYPAARAAIWLIALTFVGVPFYLGGYHVGSIVPTDKEAYWEFEFDHRPPAHYPRFHPFVYSLENCIQVLKLGEADLWRPDPNPQRTVDPVASLWVHVKRIVLSAGLLRSFRFFQVLLGWAFTSALVAGLAGVVRKD